MTGSTYICGKGKDIDILCLVTKWPKQEQLKGWASCSEKEYPDAKMRSYRKDNYNLIFAINYDYFDRWVLASRICKLINATDKDLRVKIHELIKNNNLDRSLFDGALPSIPGFDEVSLTLKKCSE